MVIKCTEIQKMAGRNTSRVDTSALKLQIERKLGNERSQKYFNLLTRYFSLKINKSEFSKLCITLIGRENLRLHNLLTQSIVYNASVGKTPPPKESEKKEVNVQNGYQNSLQTLCRDAFPRRGRTRRTRDGKLKDRPSPLGPNGRTPIVVCKDSISIPKVQESATSMLLEDGEEVEQASKSPVTAPFGFFMKEKEPRKVLFKGSCLNSGDLPDNSSLATRLEKKLKMEGLSISKDCVSLLNNGLDVYLKRLIAPCVQLAGARDVRYVRKPVSASLLDFRVAMEMNPSRLGEEWPEQLEKVCLRVSDDQE